MTYDNLLKVVAKRFPQVSTIDYSSLEEMEMYWESNRFGRYFGILPRVRTRDVFDGTMFLVVNLSKTLYDFVNSFYGLYSFYFPQGGVNSEFTIRLKEIVYRFLRENNKPIPSESLISDLLNYFDFLSQEIFWSSLKIYFSLLKNKADYTYRKSLELATKGFTETSQEYKEIRDFLNTIRIVFFEFFTRKNSELLELLTNEGIEDYFFSAYNFSSPKQIENVSEIDKYLRRDLDENYFDTLSAFLQNQTFLQLSQNILNLNGTETDKLVNYIIDKAQ